MKYQNRTDAGRHLAAWLRSYIGQPNVIVLALPRGGVTVAYEIARALRLPLDVFLVRKIGLPFHPEVAMGAIAEGGVRVLKQHLIDEAHVSQSTVDQVIARERLELDRRNRMYRRGRVLPPLKGRTIILVDDGLATGATMEAAVRAPRAERRPHCRGRAGRRGRYLSAAARDRRRRRMPVHPRCVFGCWLVVRTLRPDDRP